MKTKSNPTPEVRPGEILGEFPKGEFVRLDGEMYYRIAAYDLLEPFLMSVPSNTDLWMFVASGGGLTAGRVDADGSLFPYRTVDKLHDAHYHTGPLSSIQLEGAEGRVLRWDPFASDALHSAAIERNLYKNPFGNRLVFEEIHHELGLAFRYRWAACDEFGWVRTVTLENRSERLARITVLDGLRNILPYGAPLSLYQQASNLIDAYKRSEVDRETGLGIFSLTSCITDRAEALEMLKANTVWCCGLQRFKVHLSLDVVKDFHARKVLGEDKVLSGARGNYLVSAPLEVKPGEVARWHIVGDTGSDQVRIAALRRKLLEEDDLSAVVEEKLREAERDLRRNVGSADGLQLTAHPENWVHHFTNVLFNNMRGGVFFNNYSVPIGDFRDFLQVRNREVAKRRASTLESLSNFSEIEEIQAVARASHDRNFERLSYEYLPLYFGRRHGDPSRPWNSFSIRTKNEAGVKILNYQGNWRDIFQNWEALGASFPGFLPSMVAKFVNASTVDGFNPYRITRDGVDWEIAEADDPWSNIGYWGDHQIIYLLKLLENLDRHQPEALGKLLGQEIFSYTEVPYRIRPYEQILKNPRQTIDFDHALAARIEQRVKCLGTDGKLLSAADGSTYHANLFEKLLVPALSKLSNFILDAGIWMNTQRPEWNDANNVLGGGGVSVVTLCHLRRYLAFIGERFERSTQAEFPVAGEIIDWLDGIEVTLREEHERLSGEELGAVDRKRMMDALGSIFSRYRDQVYANGFSKKRSLEASRAAALCRLALALIDRAIDANRREDGLYHTYNLLEIDEVQGTAEVIHLQVMLEGQVAALSSGHLSPEEALEILQRLFSSSLYQAQQRSFLLYPDRELPGFMARNVIPSGRVQSIPLLVDLLARGNRSIVARDAEGMFRFHGEFKCAHDLALALEVLEEQEEWQSGVRRDREQVLDLFEEVFAHKSYTGRSGVMFGYEGLGCIYWHMVAKLLLAVQENFLRAEEIGASASVREDLASMYFRVRAGIGYEKSVEEYGAFPTDPYSHTPASGGAKQPGMTGQVKEEILTRRGELGVKVQEGCLRFHPQLLSQQELLEQPEVFHYFDLAGEEQTLALSEGSLVFTLCQVPVVFRRAAAKPCMLLEFVDGNSRLVPGDTLPPELSSELFSRSGRIQKITVDLAIGSFRSNNRR